MIELGKHLEDVIKYAEGFNYLQKGLKGLVYISLLTAIVNIFVLRQYMNVLYINS